MLFFNIYFLSIPHFSVKRVFFYDFFQKEHSQNPQLVRQAMRFQSGAALEDLLR